MNEIKKEYRAVKEIEISNYFFLKKDILLIVEDKTDNKKYFIKRYANGKIRSTLITSQGDIEILTCLIKDKDFFEEIKEPVKIRHIEVAVLSTADIKNKINEIIDTVNKTGGNK